MAGSLIDTNCLIDLLDPGQPWSAWSAAAVAAAADAGPLAIDQIILSELGAGLPSLEAVEEAFPSAWFRRLDLHWDAAFLAGRCHRLYRQAGGTRERTLPDFLIGAHAAVAGLTLVTRDAQRYRRHFPRLALVAPDTHFRDLAPALA